MKKVLLDTDIGTDVDDAVCLAYLLSQPECELVGITTVTGEAEKRAALASVICKVAGKEIPIFPGAAVPMRGEQRQTIAQQAVVLPRWPHQADFPSGQALNFMAEIIRSNPGEITLLTIGPLTNIGLLFSTYPEIPDLLNGLVMMGGLFGEDSEDQVEWNICGDPLASSIVYNAQVRYHRSVGLNVTQKVLMPEEAVRKQFSSRILKPVMDMAEVWFEQFYPCITFHDPLAAATIFDPSLCAFEQGTVEIDLKEIPGRSLWQIGDRTAPHHVAVDVDVERYFQHFFSVVGA